MAEQNTQSDENLGLALNKTLVSQGSEKANTELLELYGHKSGLNEDDERLIKAAIGADIRTGNIYEAAENLSEESKLHVQNAITSVKELPNEVKTKENEDISESLNDGENVSKLALDQVTKDRLADARARDNAQARKSLEPLDVESNNDAQARTDAGLKKQEAEELRKKLERETMLAMQGLNSVGVVKNGREITRDELIMPRAITQSYNEQNGKFFAKDGNRLMFEDKGAQLTTSTEDKKAISDMVTLAKAKQWDSLKLSGSVEFRREVWLQAESQGIKTSGYTPKAADLSALKTLTDERSINTITPLQERNKTQDIPVTKAPRHDLNKNQASMHTEATKNIANNLKDLQKNPVFAEKSIDDLNKLSYWRGVVREENKYNPKNVQDEAINRFDKQAEDPQFLTKIKSQTEASIEDKTTERVQTRETFEHSR